MTLLGGEAVMVPGPSGGERMEEILGVLERVRPVGGIPGVIILCASDGRPISCPTGQPEEPGAEGADPPLRTGGWPIK